MDSGNAGRADSSKNAGKEASISERVKLVMQDVLELQEKMEVLFKPPSELIVNDSPTLGGDVLTSIRADLCTTRMAVQEMKELMADVAKKLRG